MVHREALVLKVLKVLRVRKGQLERKAQRAVREMSGRRVLMPYGTLPAHIMAVLHTQLETSLHMTARHGIALMQMEEILAIRP